MNHFAAFVITFERADLLAATIKALFEQTRPPEKVLIVDNSASDETQGLVASLDYPLEYYRVGFNAGPAGAAKIGLERLSSEGYRWIFWGDDDNPPGFSDAFERLINLGESQERVGIVGVVGQYFDFSRGVVRRVPDAQLHATFIDVDFVAGGMSMIVSAEVVSHGILPDPRLFFGNEELDYCTRIKKGGYRIVVGGELFLNSRQRAGRMNYKKAYYIKKTETGLRREYYSLRNLLVIARKHKFIAMQVSLYIRWLLKLMFGFRYGIRYGLQNAKYIVLALKDFHLNNLGFRVKLRP